MNSRDLTEYLVGALLFLFVGSLLLGQILGQPVLLGYVETGSMEPTLEPGDGYIAVPMFVAGPVEEGDVIVFEAKTLHGGGLTTHRVVGRTDAGYITKGDANPVTDQDSGEPPVPRDRIVAKALQVSGTVVVIPNLGVLVTGINDVLSGAQRQLATTLGTRAVLGTQGIAYILFAFGVFAYAISALVASGTRGRTRDGGRKTGTVNAQVIIVGLAVVLLLILTASMVVPSGTQTFEIVSSETDAPGPDVIRTGTSENLTYVVPSNGLVPTVVYLEPASQGVNVTPQRMYVESNSRNNLTVTLTAPPQTGVYQRSFTEHRYIAILPVTTLDQLYRIHPWLPIIVIDTLIGLGFVGVALALVGVDPIRVSPRPDLRFMTRLRRWLR